ncbi:MAG TPA: aldehyde dehydrogenase [Acidimicrobiales bacterium]|nr:aldehyde dehydrogenase [Acidimicrobiales bacterium]
MSLTESTTITLNAPDHFFVGGAWVKPSSPAVIDVINASTEDVMFQVAEAKAEDMAKAVGAAREAFDHGPWPHMSHAERADYLRKIATALEERSPEISEIWSGQMGILHSMAKAGGAGFGNPFRYYAGLADDFPFVERHAPTGGGNVGLLVKEPVGVVGAIIPWNGPVGLIAYKVAPALLAGCTVVLKASPEAPGEAYIFAEIAEAIGIPPGVINVVTADREVSELLVTDPRVDKITFTGSTAAGRRIASLCGERIARVTLELGGKSAAVVLDDYDIATAAKAITSRACMMTGQVCSSLTRIVVGRDRHDDLVEALSESFSSIQVGSAFDPKSGMGPLAMERQRDRVEGYIAKGISEGATLATGGHRPEGLDRGWFIEPTVFGNVDNTNTIAQEEIFGPVLSVIPADDEQDAVNIANDTVYGLNNSVFTNDADRAYEVARRLRSGTVGQNSFRTDFGIAFGGFKQSGIGREGGREGLLPFLEPKTIILDEEPSQTGL